MSGGYTPPAGRRQEGWRWRNTRLQLTSVTASSPIPSTSIPAWAASLVMPNAAAGCCCPNTPPPRESPNTPPPPPGPSALPLPAAAAAAASKSFLRGAAAGLAEASSLLPAEETRDLL